MNLPELQLGGILLAPVIVAIVELAKRAGVPAKYAPLLNAAFSVLAYALVVGVAQYPGLLQYAVPLLQVVIIFLTTAGVYDRAQGWIKKV